MANQQGWSQQTPAVQSMLSGALGTARRVGSRIRRAAKKVKRAVSARGAKRSARSSGNGKRTAKRPARLVKGSAAAKRYMASIRPKR
jgi:hypothetical protein